MTAPSLRVAQRMNEVGFSDIVQIRNKVLDLRAAGQQVHAFHGGEPFFETPDLIKYATVRALVEKQTRYAPSSGIPLLLQALAHKLSTRNHIPVTPDQVIVTVGGAHALYSAFQAVLDPGDEVLVFSPFWTPIRDMITGAQARPVLVPTSTALRLGLAPTLAGFLTPSTRAIYYNTPQNPSGTVFHRAQAEEVAAFAREHDLLVIADEAYEDLVYEGEHVSIASLAGMAERTISTYTFSKSYAMTGWRVGYAVAQEPFMTALRKMVLYSTNGVPTPLQWAALEALKTPQDVLDARREEYRQRRDLLVNGLNQMGLPCELPAGAFYAFPDARRLHQDSRQAATLLLDHAHVATIPGVVFGPQGEGHLRLGYAVPLPAIKAGLAALRAMLG
ncbi:MAG TPA: aminotransferase class I/II-fold pyridoxal phosphate-dependent enzyme [Acidobacteriaceae bacterium]